MVIESECAAPLLSISYQTVPVPGLDYYALLSLSPMWALLSQSLAPTHTRHGTVQSRVEICTFGMIATESSRAF